MKIANSYGQFVSILDKEKDIFLLIIRLYWGWLFFRAGLWKFMNYPQASGFFEHLGLPFPEYFVIFIASVELLGGILLFLGLFSRVVALILTFNMIGALVVGHREMLLSVFSNPEDFYTAPPLTFLIVSMVVLFFGAGKFSLDYLLSKRLSYSF